MSIAIIGAAGAIGRSVADAYHAAGAAVRLVGRSKEPLDAMAAPGDSIVLADVATAKGCMDALMGVEQAVYTLGVPYTKTAFAAYPQMMRYFIEAAKACGVKRVLLITNVYAYGAPVTTLVREDHPRNPCSVKGLHRKEQEDILLAANGKGLEVVSLRLPDFYGPNVPGSLMGGVVIAARSGKTADLLGPADRPHEFVFTPDVGPVVKALLEHPRAAGEAYNFAGAGVITMQDLAGLIYAAAGQAPKLRVMAPWMQSAVGLFMPVLRELGEMRYLFTTPVLLDDSKLHALLPGVKKTPYAEGAKRIMAG
jgi:nucleoside-diphosphate-sugar epimerase